MNTYVLTVCCPTGRGIVAAVSTFLTENGCNIDDSAQFNDRETGMFFMRLSFTSETGATREELSDAFTDIAARFDIEHAFHDSDTKMKVVVMVSRFGHCLNDLLYRSRIGALPIRIVAVISNHLDYQKPVVNEDIPYHHIRVTPETKPQAEAAIMEVVENSGAELVVLARYMQVLSDAMCRKMSGRRSWPAPSTPMPSVGSS